MHQASSQASYANDWLLMNMNVPLINRGSVSLHLFTPHWAHKGCLGCNVNQGFIWVKYTAVYIQMFYSLHINCPPCSARQPIMHNLELDAIFKQMAFDLNSLKWYSAQKWKSCHHVIPNRHGFLSYKRTQKIYILKNVCPYNECQLGPKQHWILMAFIVWTNKRRHFISSFVFHRRK